VLRLDRDRCLRLTEPNFIVVAIIAEGATACCDARLT
jgi:hypothetical protein